MKTIRLYDPDRQAAPVPLGITGTHWQGAAEMAELKLKQFLGLGSAYGVLLTDRATHAIELALFWMRQQMLAEVAWLPTRTYRAVWDAAFRALVEPRTTLTNGHIQPLKHTPQAVIPTTLGGVRPWPRLLETKSAVVMDCAHTCYPGMLKDVHFGPMSFVALSFYPTKPAGMFGGGALIGRSPIINAIRAWAWPVANTWCAYYYPQTVQSFGIIHRIRHWDAEYWDGQVRLYRQLAELVQTKFDVPVFFGSPDRIETPHVLTFMDKDLKLAKVAEQCGLEFGSHYPPLGKNDDYGRFTSLPFWTDEVHERLETV
jgi:hypothetical protein